jgi:spore coat-associated protein N
MNPTNICSSGSVVQANSRNGFAILTGADLEPGNGRRAEVTIANLGTLPAAVRLFEASASNEFAAGRLTLAIKELLDDAGRRIFLGEIGTVPPGGISLGRFEAGESRIYRFTVLLAEGTPEGELERSAGAVYEWNVDPGTPNEPPEPGVH